MVKVSVIIPAYNVDKYIRQSIESIVSQTLKEIEIIVVNDGSTDDSLSIIKQIAQNDSRIQIISTPNNGQSIARNLGLWNATGQYVYFFDSDDLLEHDALELCYNLCQSEKLDFCFFDADVFSEERLDISRFKYERTHLYEGKIYNGKDILQKQLECGYSASPCLNFIDRKYLLQYNLFFYPKTIHEDELFTFMLYINASRVSCIKRNFFKRRVRGNSIMTAPYSVKNAEGYLKVCRELYSASSRYGIPKDVKRLYMNRINTLILSLYVLTRDKLSIVESNSYRKVIIKEFCGCLSFKTFFLIKFYSLSQLLIKLKNCINI